MTNEIEKKYNSYLFNHISSVAKGWKWIQENLREEIPDDKFDQIDSIIRDHDLSKYSEEEYAPYAEYFYGKKTSEVKDAFDFAWLHHQHANPHHWQHWLLQNDEEGLKVLDMPFQYIVEMICDWWAFSWVKDDLNEIFTWYKNNEKKIVLSDTTRSTVENLLEKIREKI